MCKKTSRNATRQKRKKTSIYEFLNDPAFPRNVVIKAVEESGFA